MANEAFIFDMINYFGLIEENCFNLYPKFMLFCVLILKGSSS
jgi:hypothetical protein